MFTSSVDQTNRFATLCMIALTVIIVAATLAATVLLPSANTGAFTIARDAPDPLRRALIETVYGDTYRHLPATPGRQPLQTLHARHPELIAGERLGQVFAAKENGYVLVGWVSALPADARQDFLYGLELVIGDAQARGQDIAPVINRFRERYLALSAQ